MFSLRAWIGTKPKGPKPGFVKVGSLDDFPDNSARVVVAFGRDIGVFHVGGTFQAIDNICPHSNRPIGTIDYDKDHVTCIWHGLRFALSSGICPEASHYRVVKYPVEVFENDVLVGPCLEDGPSDRGVD